MISACRQKHASLDAKRVGVGRGGPGGADEEGGSEEEEEGGGGGDGGADEGSEEKEWEEVEGRMRRRNGEEGEGEEEGKVEEEGKDEEEGRRRRSRSVFGCSSHGHGEFDNIR